MQELARASSSLSVAARVKFDLMETGISITPEAEAHLNRPFGVRPKTLADYASTSGVGLLLEPDIWVNAPIAEYNPNFVDNPCYELAVSGERLYVRNREKAIEIPAGFVPIPDYHDKTNGHGEPFTNYAHTHIDRVRISPIQGCAMRCQFCDIPYEFQGRYKPKPVVRLIEATARALDDPIQPASHVLISGGTPGKRDYEYLKSVYRAVIAAFAPTPVDIMMVPMPEIVDLDDLKSAGVNELSLNIEIFNQEVARKIMPEKWAYGAGRYLQYIETAVEALGPGRIRSILMVGLESTGDTLAGVRALAERGCVPVLSPFRPDPLTDLRNIRPPAARVMEEVYLRSRDIAGQYGIRLGPSCIACMHNTMTLPDGSDYYHYHDRPKIL